MTQFPHLQSENSKNIYFVCCYENWATRWLRGKESACQAGIVGSIPGLGRSPEEEVATHSCLGNLLDREEPGGLWSMGSQRVGHNLATEYRALQVSVPSSHSGRELPYRPVSEVALGLRIPRRLGAGSGRAACFGGRLCPSRRAPGTGVPAAGRRRSRWSQINISAV